MKELKEWTIDEYYRQMKAYFGARQWPGAEIIKAVSDTASCQYWIRPSLIDKAKYTDILWRYGNNIQFLYDTKKDLMKDINIDFSDLQGYIINQSRSLGRLNKYAHYDITIVDNNNSIYRVIDKLKNISELILCGSKFGPFTYTGPCFRIPGSKTWDMVKMESELTKDANYRVFYAEISSQEFLNEEDMFMNKSELYKDDFYDSTRKRQIRTPEYIKFLKKHTNTW